MSLFARFFGFFSFCFPGWGPTLACHKCHRIRNVSPVERDGWNLLISHLTAGLLYGRDVPKPDWLSSARKRPHHPRAHRPAPQRSKVLRRLLNG